MNPAEWSIWAYALIVGGVVFLVAIHMVLDLLVQRWFWMVVGVVGLLAGLYVGAWFLFGQWNPQLQERQAELTARVIPLDVREYLPTAVGGSGDSNGNRDDDNGSSLLSRLGDGVRDAFRSSSCNVNSRDEIIWEQKPTLTDGGWLVMRGQTKGGAQIHDPARSSGGGGNWAAFNLNNLLEGSTERAGRLRAVGNIYPAFMESRLGRGRNPPIFAYGDDYRVTETEFYVRAKLPARLLSDNIRLVVVVWPANPGFQSPALGAECVREE